METRTRHLTASSAYLNAHAPRRSTYDCRLSPLSDIHLPNTRNNKAQFEQMIGVESTNVALVHHTIIIRSARFDSP
jgi:hypothetical protein